MQEIVRRQHVCSVNIDSNYDVRIEGVHESDVRELKGQIETLVICRGRPCEMISTHPTRVITHETML